MLLPLFLSRPELDVCAYCAQIAQYALRFKDFFRVAQFLLRIYEASCALKNNRANTQIAQTV